MAAPGVFAHRVAPECERTPNRWRCAAGHVLSAMECNRDRTATRTRAKPWSRRRVPWPLQRRDAGRLSRVAAEPLGEQRERLPPALAYFAGESAPIGRAGVESFADMRD